MSESATPVILITGATSGIGYATAGNLLASGATVIVHGPTRHDADRAVRDLVAEGADPAGVVGVAADFGRLTDVAALAREVSARFDRLDVLVNNAGIAGPRSRAVTGDGNEVTFQVNYLAPYLLTRLLTPRLRAAGGRMVAVSSSLHRGGDIDWSDPQRGRSYTPAAAYAQSKLMVAMFARAVAWDQAGVTALSVHPGIVETGLLRLYGRAGRPVGEAAAVLARLSWPAVRVVAGGYYEESLPATPALLVDNHSAVARLWKLSYQILGRNRSVADRAA
jgi:NAD(P)-dependent dehydrogenase (short-subunit alcohol dehydrogenase family)